MILVEAKIRINLLRYFYLSCVYPMTLLLLAADVFQVMILENIFVDAVFLILLASGSLLPPIFYFSKLTNCQINTRLILSFVLLNLVVAMSGAMIVFLESGVLSFDILRLPALSATLYSVGLAIRFVKKRSIENQ